MHLELIEILVPMIRGGCLQTQWCWIIEKAFSLSIHKLMDTFLQWSISQLLRNMKFMDEWVELKTIILNKVTQTKTWIWHVFSYLWILPFKFWHMISFRIFTEASYLVWSQGCGCRLERRVNRIYWWLCLFVCLFVEWSLILKQGFSVYTLLSWSWLSGSLKLRDPPPPLPGMNTEL